MSLTLKQFKRKLSNIEQLVREKGFRKDLADLGRRIIFTRTKLGKGVKKNAKAPTKLKKLSPDYKAFRQVFKPIGSLGTPNKSNLTYTGEMLDSLKSETTLRGFRVFIPKSKRKDGETNSEVAKSVSRQRPFLRFAQTEMRQLENFINDEFERRLEKLKLK